MISSFIEKSYIELPLNAFGVNIEVRTSRDISNGYWNIYVRYPSFFCKYTRPEVKNYYPSGPATT